MAAERFVALEQTAGSVIGGLMRQAAAAENGASVSSGSSGGTGGDTANSQNALQDGSAGKVEYGVRYGLFSAFDGGMSVVVETLMQKLDGVSIKLNTKVLGMHLSALPGGGPSWKLDLEESGQEGTAKGEAGKGNTGLEKSGPEKSALDADQVILALPATHAGRLLQPSAPALSHHLLQKLRRHHRWW